MIEKPERHGVRDAPKPSPVYLLALRGGSRDIGLRDLPMNNEILSRAENRDTSENARREGEEIRDTALEPRAVLVVEAAAISATFEGRLVPAGCII